ncbi:hypothetical protein [Cupriavidus pinatubonensis]|uniref:hypothetical protein n=1 Tax=Cupriavidus pinatubonensis TaxID=248026 RepID=UPI0036092812
MGNSKQAAGCQVSATSDTCAPTVRQAARWLLEALDRLTAGEDIAGFHGWENALGEPAGEWVEEARHQLEVLLAATPAERQLLTNADFDVDAFESVWHSTRVQDAGRHLGWRGIAEAVWAAAFERVQVPLVGPPSPEK